MARRYTELTFTDAVKATQEHYGVRAPNARLEAMDFDDRRLAERERTFIEARDSFYMASVLENGWPYLQHRGGPTGFLKVLDDHTLGFADFRGNLQYISTGAVKHDDRVALFFMDYANRQRLKVMARAEFVDVDDRPDLLEQVEDPDYRARIERVALFHVEAFDWNCPQHITPRFSEADIAPALEERDARIAELEARVAELTGG
jgi:predicted pyridoxine 5'-phosphate oxidase superfamily flavin-nucleotide-binding protein